MEFCVLGLLLLADQSLYALHRRFSQSLALFYSASLGSLQVALRHLAAKGEIESRPEATGRRQRKVYSITPAGRRAFERAMLEPIPAAKLETVALSRIFFLGLLPEDRRRPVVELIEAQAAAALAVLDQTEQQLNALEVPEHRQDAFRFQKLTLEYGQLGHRVAVDWFRSLKESL